MRFHRQGPSTWGGLLLSLATSLLLVACSEEAPTWNGVGIFERLDLSSAKGPVVYPDLPVLERWDDFKEGKQHESWTVRGSTPILDEFQDQEILRLQRMDEDVVIELPIDHVINRRCVLDTLIVVRGQPIVFTATLFSGKSRIGSAQMKVLASANLQGIPFQIPVADGTKTKATKLVLRAAKGNQNAFLVRSLVFRQGALGMELSPDVFGGFDLVELRGDARLVTALPSESALNTTFRVESPADVLRFTFAQPESLRIVDQNATLHLLLNAGETTEKQEFQFKSSSKGHAGWSDAEIPVGKWAGSTIQAVWRTEADQGQAMCVLGQPFVSTRGAESKTVLLVTSDTHRSDHLGFLMAEGELHTDAIDKLAAEGVTFLDAVSSVNNTTPSHVALFTGLSPRDTGIVANAKVLSDAAPTLSEAYRDAGYMTLAAVSATPVDYKLCGLGQGFDRYSIPFQQGVRGSEGTLEVMLDWLSHYDGAPVFMWLHIYDAHGPYEPPDALKHMYYEEGKDPFDTEAEGADLALSPYWNKKIADPDYTEALYKSEITYLDSKLGELFDVPRVSDGILAVTADHGEVLRYGPMDPFDHRGLSLNTLAIPLIFKAPSLQAGLRRNDPVQQIDVGRTLLNLSGLESMPFPGRDVLSTSLEPGELRFALQANGISASVLTDEWMFNLNLRVPGRGKGEAANEFHAVELYDIVGDKFCRHNVWEANFEKTKVLRRAVIRWLERSEKNDWEGESLETGRDIAQELADLGYVTVEDSTDSQWFDPECECGWCQKFAE